MAAPCAAQSSSILTAAVAVETDGTDGASMSCAIFAPRRVPLSNGGEASLRARARFPGERKDGALEPMAVSRPAWAGSAHNLGPDVVLGASGAACASAALTLLRPLLYQSPCPEAPPENISGGRLPHKLPTSKVGAKRKKKTRKGLPQIRGQTSCPGVRLSRHRSARAVQHSRSLRPSDWITFTEFYDASG